MSVLLFLLSVAVSATIAEPAFLSGKNGMYQRDLGPITSNDGLARANDQSQYNEYYLYTRLNPTSPQLLAINNADSITSSNFNARLTTVVVVHGWVDNSNSSFNYVVRDAFLQKSNVNIIALDWRKYAGSSYAAAVIGVPYIGRGLGRFLDFLNKATGASFDNMHLVGFSLGAHVVGNAGRELGGKVARITGLDAAGPLWQGNSNCLKSSDAVYVEAIHTDSGIIGLGIGSAVGDVDFFLNGGSNQPGCSDNFCNHNRAWQVYAATVTYDNIVGEKCSNTYQVYTNSCKGNGLRVGNDDLRKTGSGLYRANTASSYPF